MHLTVMVTHVWSFQNPGDVFSKNLECGFGMYKCTLLVEILWFWRAPEGISTQLLIKIVEF